MELESEKRDLNKIREEKETEAHQDHHHHWNLIKEGERCIRSIPKRRRCYIVNDFISLLLTISEIVLVTWLSFIHFQHARGLVACLMLAPMVLNFIGVMYFFSNKQDSMDFERCCTDGWGKDLFQTPVLGSIFMAFHTLSMSCGCARGKGKTFMDYERFESLNVRMKQMDTFFKGAPEIKIQIFLLLVVKYDHGLTFDGCLAIVVIALVLISLAEANKNGVLSNYYRLFHDYEINDWKIPEISRLHNYVLFFYSYSCIALRLFCNCLFRSAIIYVFLGKISTTDAEDSLNSFSLLSNRDNNTSTIQLDHHKEKRAAIENDTHSDIHHQEGHYDQELASQTATIFLACLAFELKFRNAFYYFARMIKYKIFLRKKIPHGCYNSLNYSWKATLLDFGYLSKNSAILVWFYLENSLSLGFWIYSAIYHISHEYYRGTLLPIVATIFGVLILISWITLGLLLKFGLHQLHSPFSNKSGNNKIVASDID